VNWSTKANKDQTYGLMMKGKAQLIASGGLINYAKAEMAEEK